MSAARSIGVDVGTSSVKALAIDAAGTVIASAERDEPVHLAGEPDPGR